MPQPKSEEPSVLQSVLFSSEVLLNLSGIKESLRETSPKGNIKQVLKQISSPLDGKLILRKLNLTKLTASDLPLAYLQKNGQFAVLAKLADEQALIQRHDKSVPEVISRDELQDDWTRHVLQYRAARAKFDISWFIPEFIRYRGWGFAPISVISSTKHHKRLIFQ